MSKWNEMIRLSESIEIVLEGYAGKPYESTNLNNHINKFYSSDKIDMAHISIIDMRETKKMWMMHVAVFAKAEYPMPIYGFDVICGAKKITGCFHDHSPTCENVSPPPFINYNPNKERELPQWALEIFSSDMIAAGNVTNDQEIKALAHCGLTNLNAWCATTERLTPCLDYEVVLAHKNAKSKYCYNQLQNPNSKNVMISLGLDKEYVEQFKKIQFPF